jgi:hypothetical protein
MCDTFPGFKLLEESIATDGNRAGILDVQETVSSFVTAMFLLELLLQDAAKQQ